MGGPKALPDRTEASCNGCRPVKLDILMDHIGDHARPNVDPVAFFGYLRLL